MTMAATAEGRGVRAKPEQSWFRENRGAIVRHGVINLFNLIIILPLAWVLMMSLKTLPDAMRGDFWPRTFDFTHYSYVFERIDTLPKNLFNSIYVTAGTVLLTTVCAWSMTCGPASTANAAVAIAASIAASRRASQTRASLVASE